MANIISVSALNKYVKSVLESDKNLLDIALQGEISNFNKHYKTGHCYFTLKDNASSVKAVMFRGNADKLAFVPENGMKVIARCKVSLYERDGAFQIYVDTLFPDGVGAAQVAFEQLKQRLLSEGLFEGEYKKELPLFPKTIGLVTSKTGAALQDILKVAAWRYPNARFLLAPVTVQGQHSAPEIANAISMLDKGGLVDVIIVARGGGSAEDLWVFNDEKIARAAFAAKTPIVSAIGHEIDVTILDFVADLRAPTPSAAAEMVLPDVEQLVYKITLLFDNISAITLQRIQIGRDKLENIRKSKELQNMQTLVLEKRKQIDSLQTEIQRSVNNNYENSQKQFDTFVRLAGSVNPYSVLSRGFGMVYQKDIIVSSVLEIQKEEPFFIKMKDGVIQATVTKIETKQ